jgi:hypothetical protein
VRKQQKQPQLQRAIRARKVWIEEGGMHVAGYDCQLGWHVLQGRSKLLAQHLAFGSVVWVCWKKHLHSIPYRRPRRVLTAATFWSVFWLHVVRFVVACALGDASGTMPCQTRLAKCLRSVFDRQI